MMKLHQCDHCGNRGSARWLGLCMECFKRIMGRHPKQAELDT